MEVISDAIHFFQYYVLSFIVVLGIMIFFHELGHFLVAKLFGVKVLKFALGFGPVLIGKKIGDTEYSVRYFPLGGFVKMLGEDFDEEDEEDEKTEDLTPEESEMSFNNQHPLKRMGIVAAGPFFNLALALLMFCSVYFISGMDVICPEIGQVAENSPAHQAGFVKGDMVKTINGQTVETWTDIKNAVMDKAGTPLIFTVKRDGQLKNLTVVPEETTIKNEFGEDIKASLIGIVASGKVETVEFGIWQAIKAGCNETYRWIELTLLVIGKLFQGDVSIKTLGGPILIGQMTGKIAQENLGYLVPFMAIISINLGILNLFPIPILDGGLIVFLLLELVMGKPLSIKKRELAQKAGLFLLIMLMTIVIWNDVARILK